MESRQGDIIGNGRLKKLKGKRYKYEDTLTEKAFVMEEICK